MRARGRAEHHNNALYDGFDNDLGVPPLLSKPGLGDGGKRKATDGCDTHLAVAGLSGLVGPLAFDHEMLVVHTICVMAEVGGVLPPEKHPADSVGATNLRVSQRNSSSQESRGTLPTCASTGAVLNCSYLAKVSRVQCPKPYQQVNRSNMRAQRSCVELFSCR